VSRELPVNPKLHYLKIKTTTLLLEKISKKTSNQRPYRKTDICPYAPERHVTAVL
jgi:hypothetical protein